MESESEGEKADEDGMIASFIVFFLSFFPLIKQINLAVSFVLLFSYRLPCSTWEKTQSCKALPVPAWRLHQVNLVCLYSCYLLTFRGQLWRFQEDSWHVVYALFHRKPLFISRIIDNSQCSRFTKVDVLFLLLLIITRCTCWSVWWVDS